MPTTPGPDTASPLTRAVSSGEFLPDLTLWHRWHAGRRTLPDPWKGMGIHEICSSLGVAAWRPLTIWRQEAAGIDVRASESADERVTTWTTPTRTLTARWTRGPDGDWWQAEYPVKSTDDLPAALAIATARRYIVDRTRLPSQATPAVLEMPLRPFAEVLHSFIGWTEGLMLLLEAPDEIQGITDALETRYQALTTEIAALAPAVVLSPDNLDGQFVSPRLFELSMKASYARSAGILHGCGARLVVHVGGPVRALLPGLAGAGVDAIEGICGAPQSDAGIAEARAICGPGPTLWGGIAQDALLSSQGEQAFIAEVNRAIEESVADGNAIIGVADRVPVDALPARLVEIARRVRAACAGRG